jgi:hypothetical protein
VPVRASRKCRDRRDQCHFQTSPTNFETGRVGCRLSFCFEDVTRCKLCALCHRCPACSCSLSLDVQARRGLLLTLIDLAPINSIKKDEDQALNIVVAIDESAVPMVRVEMLERKARRPRTLFVWGLDCQTNNARRRWDRDSGTKWRSKQSPGPIYACCYQVPAQ